MMHLFCKQENGGQYVSGDPIYEYSTTANMSVFQTEDVGSIPTIRTRVVSDNSSTIALHAVGNGAAPLRSTKFHSSSD